MPATIESILAGEGDFEVIVVDQSENDETDSALASFRSLKNFRYLRSTSRGVAAARNLGISQASHEVIAITDDDCEVRRDWVCELNAAFAVDHRIGVVFGSVLPGPLDGDDEVSPAYVQPRTSLARTLRDKHLVDGTSACMGLRRSVWGRIGGFDEMLGVGAPLKSAAEGDLALRALHSGAFLYATPRWQVVHHGSLSRDRTPEVIERYWYGTGAMVAKAIKSRRWSYLAIHPSPRRRMGISSVPDRVSLGGRPHRAARLGAFLPGPGRRHRHSRGQGRGAVREARGLAVRPNQVVQLR